MKYYIATRLEQHALHNRLRDLLNSLDHELTYDWTVHGPVYAQGLKRINEVANLEHQGVQNADWIFVLLPGGRGTHAELGMAIALNKKIVLWSDRPELFDATPETCAFYHNDGVVKLMGSFDQLLNAVEFNETLNVYEER